MTTQKTKQLKGLSKTQRNKLEVKFKKRNTAMQSLQYSNGKTCDSLEKDSKQMTCTGEALGYRLNTTKLTSEAISTKESKKQSKGMHKTHSRVAEKSLYAYTKPRYSTIMKRKLVNTFYDVCVKTPKGF